MKKNFLSTFLLILIGFYFTSCTYKAEEKQFNELIFNDHQNLRYIEELETVNITVGMKSSGGFAIWIKPDD